MRRTAPLLAVLCLTACSPTCEESGRSWYFQRHDVYKDRGVIRLAPVYVCREVPADR